MPSDPSMPTHKLFHSTKYNHGLWNPNFSISMKKTTSNLQETSNVNHIYKIFSDDKKNNEISVLSTSSNHLINNPPIYNTVQITNLSLESSIIKRCVTQIAKEHISKKYLHTQRLGKPNDYKGDPMIHITNVTTFESFISASIGST